jgi:CRP-like cAMP-binding protein/tRNA A-37 threonylcarbamoyl transferase component Bud32
VGEHHLVIIPESSVIIEPADVPLGPSTVLEPAIVGDSLIIDDENHIGVAVWPSGSGAERLVGKVQIARGGMASIQRAFDRQVLRPVAVKRVDPERSQNLDEAAQLLVEEAQITGQLDHPHIVPVYDLLIGEDGAPMFTMKLVRGQTLSELIRASAGPSHTPAELRRILDVFLKVCDAVAFAHSRGVIHRDLKPDNVMIGSHQQVYVMDWGCALLVPRRASSEARVMLPPGSSRRAAPDTVLGTAAYMAPEQAYGRIAEIDERTDVYALGAILYEVLALRPPHLGSTVVEAVRAAQTARVTPPEQVRPGVPMPRALAQIAMRALARAPDDRFPGVQALRDAVERFVSGAGSCLSRRYAAGEIIVHEGEPGDRAFVVVSGSCEVSRLCAGIPMPERQLGPGDVFGENELLAGERARGTLVALEDVVVTVITRAALDSDLGVDAWVGGFLRALAGRAHAGAAATRVIEAVRVHLAAAGRRVRGGWLEARWSRLVRAIASTLQLAEDEVRQALVGAVDLVVDEARDTIRAPRPAVVRGHATPR